MAKRHVLLADGLFCPASLAPASAEEFPNRLEAPYNPVPEFIA
jgi:hypothetical protein